MNGWHRADRNTAAARARAKDYASAEHRQERARRVAMATPSTPCGYCGRPLGPARKDWHLPHLPDRSGYAPGLWCAPCNRKEAARRGALIANTRRKRTRVTTYRW